MNRHKNSIVTCWAALVAGLALVGPLAGEGRADFVLYGSETLTVNTNYNNGYLWDTSRAWIVSGGSVSDHLRAYDTSTVDISGGWVAYLYAYSTSAVGISDGSVNYIHAADSSTVDMCGGSVFNLTAYNTSAVDISGGSVTGEYLRVYDTGTVDISGGSVSNLLAYDSSTVTFHGRNFRLSSGLSLEGDRVMGTGTLTGEWMDGTRWGVNIQSNDSGAHILVIPEPATLSLLAVGGLLALRRRR